MSEKTERIDICIATYKRPQMLAKLLASIAGQNLPAGVTVGVIVVDNDPAGTARETAEIASRAGQQIQYFIQPQKNIALTRNMGLANASAEYIAFIDDDEYAEPEWLRHLYDTLHQYQADAVFGPVFRVLPDNTPKWIRDGGFFNGANLPTGRTMTSGAAGNALIRASWAKKRSVPFDPKYGLTGGEDFDFFRYLAFCGAKLVWCNEAIAHEIVTPERINARWLIRRAFWGGQIFAEIAMRNKRWLDWAGWIAYRFSLAIVALVGALISWPVNRAWGVRCFQKFAGNVGQLSILGKYRYEEYKRS